VVDSRPRKSDCLQTEVFYNGTLIEPPPLATELVIEHSGIYGFFKRDTRKHARGMRLCDANNNIQVALAVQTRDIVYPLARLEIFGDLFIPGLIKHQNSSREGLSPEFLRSEEWWRIQRILFEHFSPKLCELLGDDGVVRDVAINRAARDAIAGFNRVWGKPVSKQVPSGVCSSPTRSASRWSESSSDEPVGDLFPTPPASPTPSDDDTDSGGGGANPPPAPPAPAGGADTTPDQPTPPKPPRKARRKVGIPFMYKGETYILASSDTMEVNQRAVCFLESRRVFFNGNDKLLERYKKAPAALTLHIATAIVMAIESQMESNKQDAREFVSAVTEAVNMVLLGSDTND